MKIKLKAIPDLDIVKGKAVIQYVDFNVANILYEKRLQIPEEVILYADSTAVSFYLKLIRNDIECYISTDYQERLLEKVIKEGKRVFLFGDSDEILEKIKEKYDGICGVLNGYTFPDNAVDIINRSNPDIVFVGLGAGKQEEWIFTNFNLLKSNVIVSVGGWFQYLSGNKKRAPKIVRKIRLEWLYKNMKEGKRVFRRYLKGIPKFYFRVLLKKIELVK